MQILLITSHAPKSVSNEVKQLLIEISTRLNELTEKQFYMDGGKSYEEFNSMGDETVALIRIAIEKLDTERTSENARVRHKRMKRLK